MLERFRLHDFVAMNKYHACGANRWEVLRDGAEVAIICTNCRRIVMMPRTEFMRKAARKLGSAPENFGTKPF